MPATIRDQNNSANLFFERLERLEARVNALAGLQSTYLTKGNTRFVLDNNGNAVFIEGDISTAVQGVGGKQTNVSTGLSGRGAAVYSGSTWYQLPGAGATGVTSFNSGIGAITQSDGYGITGANSNPPAPAVSLTTATAFITANVALSASTVTNVASISLAAGTWALSGSLLLGYSSGAAEGDAWITTTSAGAISGALASSGTFVDSSASPYGISLPLVFVVPTATTTYYLVAEFAGTAALALARPGFGGAYVTTGLTAVRIA